MIGLLSWKIFFTGLWAQVFGLSWPIFVIVICAAFSAFGGMIPVAGIFLTPARKLAAVIAVIVAAFLVGEVRGVQISDVKWKARAAIVKQKVDDAVKTSPLDDDGWVDPYNSKDN